MPHLECVQLVYPEQCRGAAAFICRSLLRQGIESSSIRSAAVSAAPARSKSDLLVGQEFTPAAPPVSNSDVERGGHILRSFSGEGLPPLFL